MRFTRYFVLLAANLAMLQAQSSSDTALHLPGVLQDYIYGFAPVALEATRTVQTAVPDATTVPGRAPINQFAHLDFLATPSEHFIVRPNADTIYSTAWLDLSRGPIILHVPDTAGRYYLIPMLDAYSNEFASIGSRTTGTRAGDFAIVGPNSWRPAPNGLSGVVHAPTNTVWIIGRTLVRGPADLANAVAVAHQYQLIPLAAYPDFLRTGSYTPPTGVPVTPPNIDFKDEPITSSPGFSNPEFFDVLSKYALENPPPPDQLAQASAFVLDGFIHQNQLTPDIVKQANAAFTIELAKAATNENGWSFDLKTGNYGTNYGLRAAVAKFGLGANSPADAVYPGAVADITGKQLVGTSSYVIHFAPGQTPPAHGFWSLTVYDQNGFLVTNPINRYSVGSETGLVPNPDGSLDIFLQTSEPSTHQSNWLPTPSTLPDVFTLTLRIYWPDQSVLTGAWMPPPITPVSAPLP